MSGFGAKSRWQWWQSLAWQQTLPRIAAANDPAWQSMLRIFGRGRVQPRWELFLHKKSFLFELI